MSVKENVWDIRSLLTKEKSNKHTKEIFGKQLSGKKTNKQTIEEGLSRKMVIPKGEI